MKLFFLTIVFYCVSLIEPHGFLTKPSPRQFIHYYRPDIPPFNGDPSALFCGTFEHQYYLNDGKCGLCGDEYSQPKLFEQDGLYATGTIVEYYLSGQTINISHHVVVDGFHGGYVEVFICPLTDSMNEATEECFEKFPLRILPHPKRSPIDEYKILIDLGEPKPYGEPLFIDEIFQVKLPYGLTCERCVLRWRWKNDQKKGLLQNGTELIGIGAQQEFRNCADISIIPNPNIEEPIEEFQNPPLRSNKMKPVYQCETWKEPNFSLNTKPDLNKYSGSGLICWNKVNDFWYDPNLYNQHFEMCIKCFINCMTPDMICPDECICRWYE